MFAEIVEVVDCFSSVTVICRAAIGALFIAGDPAADLRGPARGEGPLRALLPAPLRHCQHLHQHVPLGTRYTREDRITLV